MLGSQQYTSRPRSWGWCECEGIQCLCRHPVLQAVTAMGKALMEFVWALRFHTDSWVVVVCFCSQRSPVSKRPATTSPCPRPAPGWECQWLNLFLFMLTSGLVFVWRLSIARACNESIALMSDQHRNFANVFWCWDTVITSKKRDRFLLQLFLWCFPLFQLRKLRKL